MSFAMPGNPPDMSFAMPGNPPLAGFTLQPFLTLARRSDWVKPTLTVTTVDGGYALRLEVKHRQPCWLFAEKSGRIRIFKRADTALELCRRVGLSSVTVHLQREPL